LKDKIFYRGLISHDFTIFDFTKLTFMGMNKNTVLAWATFIMILVGLGLIGLGAFRYDDVAGWGFASVGIGFFAIAWVFNALKGRV
jgi:fatty acid desaturase